MNSQWIENSELCSTYNLLFALWFISQDIPKTTATERFLNHSSSISKCVQKEWINASEHYWFLFYNKFVFVLSDFIGYVIEIADSVKLTAKRSKQNVILEDVKGNRYVLNRILDRICFMNNYLHGSTSQCLAVSQYHNAESFNEKVLSLANP